MEHSPITAEQSLGVFRYHHFWWYRLITWSLAGGALGLFVPSITYGWRWTVASLLALGGCITLTVIAAKKQIPHNDPLDLL